MAKRTNATGIPMVQTRVPATQSPAQRFQERRHKKAIQRAQGGPPRIFPKVKFK